MIEGRRGGEAAGCSAEVDVAGPAELATSVGQRSWLEVDMHP